VSTWFQIFSEGIDTNEEFMYATGSGFSPPSYHDGNSTEEWLPAVMVRQFSGRAMASTRSPSLPSKKTRKARYYY
jgi:hypothetical protein